jgi:hypothetical protein
MIRWYTGLFTAAALTGVIPADETIFSRSDRPTTHVRYPTVRKIDSLGKICSLGSFLAATVAAMLVVVPANSAQAWSGRRPRVYVPLAPTYAVQNGMVAQSPGVTYSYAPMAGSYAPMAGAPVGMAPGSGVFNGAYYAPMAGAPAAMAPSFTASSTMYAPQGFQTGPGFAPTGSSFFGNLPPRINGSRMTSDDGRKDVLDDVRENYRETKASEKSRIAIRKALKEQARQKYVDVIGGEVQAVDDLNDSENKEIDQIVDMVMREDASANSASPYGNANPYQYPYPYPNPNPYPSGNGFVGQPMFYYFFAYPIAPPVNTHHQHHLFHHQ